ncbi:MAG: hypothetical protein CME81_09910 [Halomonas sp.]|nr:hypothetical protein [Halomonas sp.]
MGQTPLFICGAAPITPSARSGLALIKGRLASFVTPCSFAAALAKSAGVTHPHARVAGWPARPSGIYLEIAQFREELGFFVCMGQTPLFNCGAAPITPAARSGLALLKGRLASFVPPCSFAAALVKSAGVTHPHASDLVV